MSNPGHPLRRLDISTPPEEQHDMTSIITTASTAAETSRGDGDRPDAARVWTDQVVTDRLLAAITGQQHRILGILDGLDEQTVRRPVLPSGWSCLGMVQHLTGMTWFWFVEVMAGRLGEHPVRDSFEVPGDLP